MTTTVDTDMGRDEFAIPIPATSEEALVSAVLASPDVVRFAVEHVAPQDFHDPRLAALFSLVVGMRGAGLPVDSVSVATEALRKGGPRAGYPDPVLIDRMFSYLVPGAAATVDYHARRVRDAAVARQLQALAQRLYQDAADPTEVAQTLATAATDLARIRDGAATASTWEAITLRELLAEPVEYDWLIPGLLERGDRFVLTAGEGAGKSTFLRQLALLACAGIHPFKYHPIDPVDVLVVDAENTKRQWKRAVRGIALQAAAQAGDAFMDRFNIRCTGRLDLRTEKHLGAVHRLLDTHDPGILVIGSLYKLTPNGINTEEDASAIIAALDSIHDRGVCLLIEAHAGHAKTSAGNRDLRVRGSSAIMAWPEFGYALELDPQQENIAHLVRWRGDREEREWPEAVARGGRYPWTDINYRPGGHR